MSEKIIITSDSTSDLSKELIERYDIKVLPLGVTIDDKTYLDGVEINPDMIFEYHDKTGKLAKTTATNIDECTEFFGKLTADGSSVIHFSLSSEMSSTYNNARIAAEDFPNVYVIDSRNLSNGIALLMLKAFDLIKEGLTAKEIVEKIEELKPNVDSSFVLDTLEYLYKGGRCSALSVMGANLLKLKPCIQVKDGTMGIRKKYRGKQDDVIIEYVKESLADLDNIYPERVFITDSGCNPETMAKCVEIVKELGYFKEIFRCRAGCTISSHCGTNCFGILFIRKSSV